MRNFRIKFCWVTPLPIKIIYKGVEITSNESNIIVRAKNSREVIDNLKGTDVSVISNINSIREC